MRSEGRPPGASSGLGRRSTGSAPLDRLLEGGLEPDGLTQLYGEGGSGKTILCLSAALATVRGGEWVIYLDTEGLSTERVTAMSGGEPETLLRRMLLSTPKDLGEQDEAVHTAARLLREGRRRVGLVVLDSATLYYRLSLGGADEEDARGRLMRELAELLSAAISAGVAVLYTNQVWRNVTTGTLEALGGPFLNHLSKTILRLDRLSGDRRRAVLVKHRSLPESSVEFRITSAGLE